ncbi:hypothetical protein O0882_20955 [Janthinobacterium sp. SUN073]|uniref:hypothetical protein n=1 Tax=Janthinobacterium sp. SUN073 TaxID=3004102 RepID=UPI0025AF01C5|nr:hypothetical protein [Janthinobacterium sp. SUN073]MDN2698790.1 hypothetical protein [Janthinobacterium sp. SUN073]
MMKVAELAAARKSCLEEARQGKRTRQEYNINVILVVKLIIATNIQWHASNKSYDCRPSRRPEVGVIAKLYRGELVFFNSKVFVVNSQHH